MTGYMSRCTRYVPPTPEGYTGTHTRRCVPVPGVQPPVIEIPVKGSDRPALVSSEDAHLAERSWRLQKGYPVARVYAGHRNGKGRKRNVSMHRWILGLAKGDEREGDHINRDPLDNRRSNLRIATRLENAQNTGAHRRWGPKPSAYRGVHWDGGRRKWVVEHRLNRKLHRLGWFDDEQEAARVAADWRREHMPFSAEARRPDPQEIAA